MPYPFIQRHPGVVKGLTGDARNFPSTPAGSDIAAQLIDAEWDTPGAFLVTGVSQGIGAPTWTLRTGIDRAMLVSNLQFTNDFFSQIVIARSIALSFRAPNAAGLGPGFAQAIAVPISLDGKLAAEIVNAQSSANGLGSIPAIPHANVSVGSVATNVASVAIAAAGFSGVSVQNISPAGRNLYLRPGTAAATTVAGGYQVKLVPGAYWESPWSEFGQTAAIQGIWDGADAAGFANITTVA